MNIGSVVSKPSIVTRFLPSTSTFTVPSGSFSNCSTEAITPIVCTSLGFGLSSLASFCVARTISLSPRMASSNARTDFSRPTNKGETRCGNTTMSRKGSKGSIRVFVIMAPQPRNSRISAFLAGAMLCDNAISQHCYIHKWMRHGLGSRGSMYPPLTMVRSAFTTPS